MHGAMRNQLQHNKTEERKKHNRFDPWKRAVAEFSIHLCVDDFGVQSVAVAHNFFFPLLLLLLCVCIKLVQLPFSSTEFFQLSNFLLASIKCTNQMQTTS